MNTPVKTTSNPSAEESPKSPGAFPFPTAERHDQPAPVTAPVIEQPSEDAIDHGLEESFPASDPVSVAVTKVVPKPGSPI